MTRIRKVTQWGTNDKGCSCRNQTWFRKLSRGCRVVSCWENTCICNTVSLVKLSATIETEQSIESNRLPRSETEREAEGWAWASAMVGWWTNQIAILYVFFFIISFYFYFYFLCNHGHSYFSLIIVYVASSLFFFLLQNKQNIFYYYHIRKSLFL